VALQKRLENFPGEAHMLRIDVKREQRGTKALQGSTVAHRGTDQALRSDQEEGSLTTARLQERSRGEVSILRVPGKVQDQLDDRCFGEDNPVSFPRGPLSKIVAGWNRIDKREADLVHVPSSQGKTDLYMTSKTG
jgi:hypothetical protein